MRTLLLAAAAAITLGGAAAHAAEGNGPAFPGYHLIGTGLTSIPSRPEVVPFASTTLLDTANANVQPVASLSSRLRGTRVPATSSIVAAD